MQSNILWICTKRKDQKWKYSSIVKTYLLIHSKNPPFDAQEFSSDTISNLVILSSFTHLKMIKVTRFEFEIAQIVHNKPRTLKDIREELFRRKFQTSDFHNFIELIVNLEIYLRPSLFKVEENVNCKDKKMRHFKGCYKWNLSLLNLALFFK